jgi:hypothetical protein
VLGAMVNPVPITRAMASFRITPPKTEKRRYRTISNGAEGARQQLTNHQRRKIRRKLPNICGRESQSLALD